MNSQIFTLIGLTLDIIGVIILFFNGLPFNANMLNSYTEIEIKPEWENKLHKQKIMSYFSLIILALGFIFQLIGSLTQNNS